MNIWKSHDNMKGNGRFLKFVFTVRDSKRWWPLVPYNVQVYASITVDTRMINFCIEMHLQELKVISLKNFQIQCNTWWLRKANSPLVVWTDNPLESQLWGKRYHQSMECRAINDVNFMHYKEKIRVKTNQYFKQLENNIILGL